MQRFWRLQIRYRLARRLIHVGLWIMPEGRYKDGLMAALWALYDQVVTTTQLRQETHS